MFCPAPFALSFTHEPWEDRNASTCGPPRSQVSRKAMCPGLRKGTRSDYRPRGRAFVGLLMVGYPMTLHSSSH
jgi:hypothetical protein